MAGILKQRSVTRWLAPVAAVAFVAVGAVVTTAAASADDAPVLPPRSAEQLLVDLHQPTTAAFSGEIAVHADLGLPAIAGLLGGTSGTGVVPPHAADAVAGDTAGIPALGGLTGLLSGDSTLRVWSDAPDRTRVAIVSGGGEESDVVKNGTDLWVWQSSGSQVLHATLPSPDEVASHLPDAAELPDELSGLTAQLPKTPQEAAAELLDAVGPTTNVSSESTASVAGRAAYLLVATPKTPGTLVARIVVAIDAQTHLPLRLEVYSTQRTTAAASIGFTSVSFETPSADVFAFTPPAGATVTEIPEDLRDLADLPDGTTKPALPNRPDAGSMHGATHPDVTTVGEGWATIVVLTPPADAPAAQPTPGDTPSGLIDALPEVTGDWGSGHALAGTLFSVLVADDGRVALGAVPVSALEDALAGTTP